MNDEPEGRIIGEDSERSEIDQELARRLDELTDRFKRLTGQTESEDDARIRSVEQRCTDLANRITRETQRINHLRGMVHSNNEKLDQRVTNLEQPIPRPEEWAQSNRVLERITALENGSRLVGTGGLIASLVDRLERLEAGSVVVGTEAARLIPTDQIRRAEREFSSGSDGPDVFRMSNQEGPGAQILTGAERRIRQYLAAGVVTTQGVIDALWGRHQDNEDYRGRFVAKVKDQPQA